MAIQSNTAVLGDGNDPDEDPTLLRRRLGVQLRKLRSEAGLTGYAVADAIGASHSKISRLETGLLGFRLTDLENLLTVYRVTDPDTRAEFIDLARRANGSGRRRHVDADAGPRWFDSYLRYEETATELRGYAPGVIPELLRTPAYARAALTVAHHATGVRIDVERRIEVLKQRQQRLTGSAPPRLWVVIEQAALRRQLGDRQVRRDQLKHLLRVASELPHVTVQILPDHVCGPVISAFPFTVLRFAATDLTDVVHIHYTTGAQFLEKRSDVDTYHVMWDHLCLNALPPDRSLRAIAAAAD
ncbi:helix-turn-helix domain-containing protein [Nocardia wallacei]|uniref:helix-turn-helix domain-containing protein n=1 Tax=Nocardia wallacei TaxID=480035 RepID=UPI002458C14C|nr:helix-turn-helix transcriptional regulator [Nocardia wallacei]